MTVALSSILLLAAALAVPAPQHGDANSSSASGGAPPVGLYPNSGFHGLAALGSGVGPGLFGPQWAPALLLLRPGYGVAIGEVKLDLSGEVGLGLELALPDSPTGRRLFWSDLRLVLAAPRLWRAQPAQLGLSPYLVAAIPLRPSLLPSPSIGAGAQLDGRVGSAALGWRTEAGLGQTPSVDPTAGGFLCRPGDRCGAGAGTVGWRNSLLAELIFTERLSFGGALSLQSAWRQAPAAVVDEYRPTAVDVDGNPVARTGGTAQHALSAQLFAQLRLGPHFGLTLSVPSALWPQGGIHAVMLTGWVRSAPSLEPAWLP
jgi:hypothetical protein